ncbi:MAG: hypothetical protein GY694_17610 [Gammaproteobacteria bacterium]|nr:hypothetical protein [Gammaproteobacteria bacterium]
MIQRTIFTLIFLNCLSLSSVAFSDSHNIEKMQSEQLVFLHFNDFYDVEAHYGKGGLRLLSQIIEQQKQKNPNVIVTFGGDLLSPSLYSRFTKGRHMIDAMALLHVDFAVPGNHEFDFGVDNAVTQFNASKFPWIISNFHSSNKSLQHSIVQSFVHDINGFKIGFLGLITPELTFTSGTASQIKVTSIINTALQVVKTLKKQKVDIIVALTHLTLEEDKQLAKQVNDIDLILGGHDHYPANLLLNGTPIIKAGMNGEYLAVIKINMDKKVKNQVALSSWQLLSTSLKDRNTSQDDNELITHYLKNYKKNLNKISNRYLTMPLIPLDARAEIMRSEESNFGNLITDAMRHHYKTDMALINGGAIRGDKVFPANVLLSEKDILSALPFANRVVVVKISGKQLVEILEQGLSAVEKFSGRFPQISGFYFDYSPQLKPGHRVKNVTFSGKPIKPETVYTMATIDYLFKGGDGYKQFAHTETIIGKEEGDLISNIASDYLSKLKQIKFVQMGRIKADKQLK